MGKRKKKGKSSNIFKILSIVFIIAGLGIVTYALGTRYYANYKKQKLIDEYNQSVQNMKEEKQDDNTQDEDKPEENTEEENKDETQDLGEGVIALVEIPKIDVVSPVREMDTSDEAGALGVLKWGTGHFSETGLPGEEGRNCALAGHRSYTYGEDFNRLDEVEKGDEIYVDYKGKKYLYIADDISVVLPEEVSVLDDTPGKTTVTLITCTPIRVGTHRLVIKGTLKSVE